MAIWDEITVVSVKSFISFILLLLPVTINNTNLSYCHAYNGIIATFHMPIQQRHCSYCDTPKLLQHMKISSYHRCWQFCNTREPKPRSLYRSARIQMTTDTTANSVSASEQTAIKSYSASSSGCGCGLNHYVQDDSNHFHEINAERNNNNDMVIRNVYQSTIDPSTWQQYMVPPMSWWDAITSQLVKNENLYSVDVSLRWNYTLDDTILTTTAERFLELYETKSAVVRRNRQASWWSRVPTINGTTSCTPNQYREVMIQNIASAMKQFSTFCSNSRHSDDDDDDENPSFRRRRRSWLSLTIRLLCTYGGSRAGTKCPIWHIDHVPCRYIQTLYGPTCLFINNSRDNHIVYNRIVAQHQEEGKEGPASDLDDSTSNEEFLSVEERNEFLLRGIDVTTRSVIGQATVGEGIVLLGKLWPQWATGTATTPPFNDDQTKGTTAAVHKSPQILTPNQGRILLTININE